MAKITDVGEKKDNVRGVGFDVVPHSLKDLDTMVTKGTGVQIRPDSEMKQMVKQSHDKKSINFEAWGGFESFLQSTSGGAGMGSKMQVLRRVVPWLAKATDMTALAVSELPFEIQDQSGKVIDSSSAWKNVLGGIPSPQKLIYNIASSLCLGRAYSTLEAAPGHKVIVDLHYCPPHTVQPIITTSGLQHFVRSSEWGQSGVYYPAGTEPKEGFSGEMVYFWLPDSDIEIGPAKSYPAGTALLSSELITSMDATLQAIAEAGFIPPTILSAKGMPTPAELAKQESWWNRFLRRWSTETAKIINAENMNVVKVGAGMEELKGIYSELYKAAIENVAAAYGIPPALFMSDMAFATEVQPMIKMWYSSSVFIRIYRTIESGFNEQLLSRWGYSLMFKPETIDAFQEDEQQRGAAYRMYVSAGMRPSIAGEMLGLDLPEEIEYTALDEMYDKDLNAAAPVAPVGPLNNPLAVDETKPVVKSINLTAEQIKDLNLWRQVAVRNARKGKKTLDFECKSLSKEMVNSIREKLVSAKTNEDVVSAFEIKSIMNSKEVDEIGRIQALLELNLKALDK